MVLALIALLVWGGEASAAAGSGPKDALTENSSSSVATQFASAYVDRTMHRCKWQPGETSLQVTCKSGGYAALGYDFTVPGKAINMRPTVTGSGKLLVEQGSRSSKRTFRLYVTMGRGTHTVEAVELRLDVPTTFDTRPCVTDGEWARINVWLGGYGGTIADVAAVFDTDGKRTHLSQDYDGFQFQERAYKRCGSHRTRKLTFHHHAGHPGWHSYWG
jgi:hypothetical protein